MTYELAFVFGAQAGRGSLARSKSMLCCTSLGRGEPSGFIHFDTRRTVPRYCVNFGHSPSKQANWLVINQEHHYKQKRPASTSESSTLLREVVFELFCSCASAG